LSHSFLTSPPPPHIYTLSLHDALPICQWRLRPRILFRSQEGLHAPPFNPPWFFGSFTFVPCSFFRDSWTLGHASAGACSREGRRCCCDGLCSIGFEYFDLSGGPHGARERGQGIR